MVLPRPEVSVCGIPLSQKREILPASLDCAGTQCGIERSMHYRVLGRTGLRVSEIGFGAWGIGGQQERARRSYGPTDDATSLAAFEAAWELGCNFIDTADAY